MFAHFHSINFVIPLYKANNNKIKIENAKDFPSWMKDTQDMIRPARKQRAKDIKLSQIRLIIAFGDQ
jgi:hypothetical protein